MCRAGPVLGGEMEKEDYADSLDFRVQKKTIILYLYILAV